MHAEISHEEKRKRERDCGGHKGKNVARNNGQRNRLWRSRDAPWLASPGIASEVGSATGFPKQTIIPQKASIRPGGEGGE